MAIETYFRSWQIDGQGNVQEVPFPKDEPLKEWNQDNIYSLNPHYTGMFTKKIKHFEITIFNWKPRNVSAEKNLAELIRTAILQDFDRELVERSSGIDHLMATIDWFEWW